MTAPHKLTAAMRQHKPKLRSTKTHAPNLLRPTSQRSVHRRTSASTAARNASAASKISACRNNLRNTLSTRLANRNNPPSHTCRTRAPISASAPRYRPGITSIPAAPPRSHNGHRWLCKSAPVHHKPRMRRTCSLTGHVLPPAGRPSRMLDTLPARRHPKRHPTRVKRTSASDCDTYYRYSSNNPSGRENSTSRRSMSSATIISSTAGT